jgi:hypothetical protein
MIARIQNGDYGQILRNTFLSDGAAYDVSAATAKLVMLRDPDGIVKQRTAVFSATGTDGKIQYTLASGDIDKAGGWEVQFVVRISGIEFKSELHKLTVGERLT